MINCTLLAMKALFVNEFPDPRPRAHLIAEPSTDLSHDASRIKAAADKRARKMAKRLKERVCTD